MEVELTRHNLLQRGVTPPPEEKVAYYVYQQSKVQVDPPGSNAPTEIMASYSREPVAWAPELPTDWHSQEFLANQPAFPPTVGLTRNNSSVNMAGSSFPSMSRLDLAGGNRQGNWGAMDPDLADLEAEVMGGSEVDYNIGQAPLPDIASDIQEQSVGQRTPQIRNTPLAHDVPSIKSGREAGTRHSRSVFDPQGPLPSIRGDGSIPGTPKTTGIHIHIQPPTDPSLSKVPSRAPSRQTNHVTASPAPSPAPLRRTVLERQAAGVVPSSPRHVDNAVASPQQRPPSSPSPLRTPKAEAPARLPDTVVEAPLPPTPKSLPAPQHARQVENLNNSPAVQTSTPVAKPTATKKMAKGKKGKAAKGKKGKAAAADDEEVELTEVTPATEQIEAPPATPVAATPAPGPSQELEVKLEFGPDGRVASMSTKITPKPLPVALEPEPTPEEAMQPLPDRAGSRAPTIMAASPMRQNLTGLHDDPLRSRGPSRAPTAADPMSPKRSAYGGSQLGDKHDDFATAPSGRSRAASRASQFKSPFIAQQAIPPEPMPIDHLGFERPASRARSHITHQTATPRANPNLFLDGEREEEVVSIPASTFRAPSRHGQPSERAVSPRPLPQEATSLDNIWEKFQNGSSIKPPPSPRPFASPLPEPAMLPEPVISMPEPLIMAASPHSRAPSLGQQAESLLEIPSGKSRRRERAQRLSSVSTAPDPEQEVIVPVQIQAEIPVTLPSPTASRHAREPSVRGSIIAAEVRSPSVRAQSIRAPPSAREPSMRAPSAREPSVREPSIREPSIRSPSVREPSIRAQSPPLSARHSRLNGHMDSPARSQFTAPRPTSPRMPEPQHFARSRPMSPTSPTASAPRSARPHMRERSVRDELAALERMQEEDEDRDDRTENGVVERLSRKQAVEAIRTPRTSYSVSPSVLAAETNRSRFQQEQHDHDEDLCVLMSAADDPKTPEVVRKAVKKAVKSRLRKLGYENEEQYLKQNGDHAHGRHRHRWSIAESASAKASYFHAEIALTANAMLWPAQQAPAWAKPLFDLLEQAQERLDSLDHKIESSRPTTQNSRRLGYNHTDDEDPRMIEAEHDDRDYEPGSDVDQSPRSANAPLRDSRIDDGHRHRASLPVTASTDRRRGYDAEDDYEYGDEPHAAPANGNGIEEELYRLKLKNPTEYEESMRSEQIPDIPGSEFDDLRETATPTPRRVNAAGQQLTPTSQGGPAFVHDPDGSQAWGGSARGAAAPPWQLVHSRLLNWTIVWSMSEIERALDSTERGHQVDECALTIWTTQCYKRYVRVRTSEHPPQKVDRLFVPPNVADAINSAVYNGRHADACSMLKDLWTPFGFEGMPRLILVLAKHRRDTNHWVVHRFSIPEGTLCTYDTYPEKALADGRPLGWWFAIRAAWPHAMYPNPDHLVQKLVRIHRPLQLLIDNSIAAAAIWRNLLMGSKAERSVDLVRMRDLIHTEVRAIKMRKEQGKLALHAGRASWDRQITES